MKISGDLKKENIEEKVQELPEGDKVQGDHESQKSQ